MIFIKRMNLAAVAVALNIIGISWAQDEFTLEGNQWVESAQGSSDPNLTEARSLLAADKPVQARKILDAWIKDHEYEQHPDLAEAYLLRGDAKLLADHEYSALYDYELIAKRFTGTPAFPKAIERESEIARRYINGLRRRWFGWLRLERAEGLGEELLIRTQERMPGSQLAEQAALELADYYYRRRDLPMASDMYGIIVSNYPDSKFRKYAALREIYTSIASFKGPHYDSSPLVESRILIDEFQARYPADAEQAGVTTQLESWVDESEAAHLLDTGMWYLSRNDEASARFVFRRLVRDNPRSAAASEAVRLMQERGWLDNSSEETTSEESSEDGADGSS